MATKKLSTVEEINEIFNFTAVVEIDDYQSGKTRQIRRRIERFTEDLMQRVSGNTIGNILNTFANDMAGASDNNIATLHDYVLSNYPPSSMEGVKQSDRMEIMFDCPLDLRVPWDPSIDVQAVAGIWLFLWSKIFPIDVSQLRRAPSIYQKFVEAEVFYSKVGTPQRVRFPTKVRQAVSNTKNSARRMSTAEMRNQFASLLDEHNDAIDQKFKNLGSVFVSKHEKANLAKSITAANTAKTGFDKQKDDSTKTITENSNKLADIIKRAEEFAKYKALDGYFEKKAADHRIRFGVWLSLFIGSLIAVVYYITKYNDEIKPMLPSFNNGAFSLGSSAFVIAITLAIVWMLRVFIRLAMLNLQLGEDASNRTVLIRTLAALESESKTDGLPNEQKIIAYNAIFRASLSDNSNLDVAQPSLGDLSGLMRPK